MLPDAGDATNFVFLAAPLIGGAAILGAGWREWCDWINDQLTLRLARLVSLFDTDEI